MKYTALLAFILLFSCGKKENAIKILISPNQHDSSYHIKVCNQTSEPIYVLDSRYYDDMLSGDSVIFEPFYTFYDSLWFCPNVYSPPKTICINRNSFYEFIIARRKVDYDMHTDYHYHLRVYTRDFASYADSLQYTPYVGDFKRYQQLYSTIVKANIKK